MRTSRMIALRTFSLRSEESISSSSGTIYSGLLPTITTYLFQFHRSVNCLHNLHRRVPTRIKFRKRRPARLQHLRSDHYFIRVRNAGLIFLGAHGFVNYIVPLLIAIAAIIILIADSCIGAYIQHEIAKYGAPDYETNLYNHAFLNGPIIWMIMGFFGHLWGWIDSY